MFLDCTTQLPVSRSCTTTLLLQKPLNLTCAGGISLSTVGMVSASESVITLRHIGHQLHYLSPVTHRVHIKIRLDLPIILETLQRSNCHHTAICNRALTSCQPFLKEYYWNVYSYNYPVIPAFLFLWQLVYLFDYFLIITKLLDLCPFECLILYLLDILFVLYTYILRPSYLALAHDGRNDRASMQMEWIT